MRALVIAVAIALGTLAPLGCAHDLRRVPDDVLRQLPPGDMRPVFDALAERDRARAEREHHVRALVDLDTELAIAGKDLDKADAELDKQRLEEDLARDARNPDRLNTAYRNKDRAGLARKVAEAHELFLRQRGEWLRAARDAAALHARAADARAEQERAQLCVRKGLRPTDDFQPEAFATQWQGAHAAWEQARDRAAEQERRLRQHEKRWRDLEAEARALGALAGP